MGFLKILPLLIPLLIFLFPILVRTYIKSKFTKTKDKKNELMVVCSISDPSELQLTMKKATMGKQNMNLNLFICFMICIFYERLIKLHKR